MRAEIRATRGDDRRSVENPRKSRQETDAEQFFSWGFAGTTAVTKNTRRPGWVTVCDVIALRAGSTQYSIPGLDTYFIAHEESDSSSELFGILTLDHGGRYEKT